MGNFEQREQSEFNMAVSYLNRLNTLFYIADDAAMNLDMNKWMHSLMAIFRELSTEMNDKEMLIIKDETKKANHFLQQQQARVMRVGKNDIPTELYDLMHEIEIKLRKVLKTSGLQMKMKDAADMALG